MKLLAKRNKQMDNQTGVKWLKKIMDTHKKLGKSVTEIPAWVVRKNFTEPNQIFIECQQMGLTCVHDTDIDRYLITLR